MRPESNASDTWNRAFEIEHDFRKSGCKGEQKYSEKRKAPGADTRDCQDPRNAAIPATIERSKD
jgi:hypothetical protein